MEISQFTIEQLKSLAYDQVKLMQATQNNIGLIEQELAKRANAPIEETPIVEGE